MRKAAVPIEPSTPFRTPGAARNCQLPSSRSQKTTSRDPGQFNPRPILLRLLPWVAAGADNGPVLIGRPLSRAEAECMTLPRWMFHTSLQLYTGHEPQQPACPWQDGIQFGPAENFPQEKRTGKVQELQPRVSAASPRRQVADG